jgi:two-component system response regulator AtoC
LSSVVASSSPGSESAAREGLLSRILVLDADDDQRRALQLLLTAEGCVVAGADTTDNAVRELESRDYDALFCDVDLIPAEHLEAIARPPLVIVIAGDGQDERGLEAVDTVAFDCVSRPFDGAQIALAVRRAVKYERVRRAQRPTVEVRGVPSTPDGNFGGMVGASKAMRAVFHTINKVAAHKATVLINGESGTGKELVARAIHDMGPRAGKPFIAVNCGAIPPTLLESELFGHRRGAFTDAVRDKAGLFEEADSGTLFLDEIGEMPTNLQVKLLRAIQEEEIRRIGDNAPIKIDVRIVAATLRDLTADVATGRFREDLFYRLNVLPVVLPPLRDRTDDIAPLVDHFVGRYTERHPECVIDGVSPDAMDLLQSYRWPGNIRELENAIERAMVLCEGSVIEAPLLQDKLAAEQDPIRASLASGELSIKKTTRVIENELIRRALETTQGNRTNAAKLLEISHRALLYKIKEYGL